jgi:uncharacterized protein (UPF0276 family)
MIHSSLACNLDHQLLHAALPLFASEKVAAIEWSFDTLFQKREIPEWFSSLIKAYSDAGRLVGHGVYYSLFSGKWTKDQQHWLDHLQRTAKQFPFDHVTEHFGFMTGEDFHKGAPMSVPFNSTTLAIGRDRLQRMQQACACPVGVENLAFSYSLDEVKNHGQFLHDLVEPINGFIILDLHNAYCQMMNFDIAADELLSLYPLERVREIHISGGSWDDLLIKQKRSIRRDTHDDAVPAAVFELLQTTLDQCPNIKYVVLEQLGTSLEGELTKLQFQADFYHMHDIVQVWNDKNQRHTPGDFSIPQTTSPPVVVESEQLAMQQADLTRILETADDHIVAKRLLEQSSLANSDWKSEGWNEYMLETAIRIARKWKHGFAEVSK